MKTALFAFLAVMTLVSVLMDFVGLVKGYRGDDTTIRLMLCMILYLILTK